MPSYSVKEKLEALEIACRINNISDDRKLELTNNIIRSMGFTIEKSNASTVRTSKKFIDGRLGEYAPFESISLMLGFQLDEKSFIELSKRAAKSLGFIVVNKGNSIYLKSGKTGLESCYKNDFGYDKDMAFDLYDKFDIKSESLFGDICYDNNK